MRSTSITKLALMCLAVGACTIDRDPSAPMSAESPALLRPASSVVEIPGRYIVAWNGDAGNFAAQVSALGATVESLHQGAGLAVVEGLSSSGASELKASSDVLEVVADEVVSLDPEQGLRSIEPVSSEVQSVSNPAGASVYPFQWNLRAIKADQAWHAGRLGSSDVRVAILDTGVDYLHPDLAGKVDLANSASFVPSDDSLVARFFPTRNAITDLHYHGTHVAATVSSNALGAAGVTSRVTLMAVKVLGVDGRGPVSGVLDGVIYAADHGADVINLSLGSAFTRAGNKELISMIRKAFAYAFMKGALVVVAAGNSATNLDADRTLFQAYCGLISVVCVSATGPTSTAGPVGPFTNVDAPAFYSNHGRFSIDVAAPGGNRGATTQLDPFGGWVWAACSRSSLVIPSCRAAASVVNLMGTSQAAPHVAGLAALLVEDVGRNNPLMLRLRLEFSADDLGPRGNDGNYGRGRINVARALRLPPTP